MTTYEVSSFNWKVQMFWDLSHPEECQRYVNANILAMLGEYSDKSAMLDNKHLNFQPDENGIVDLDDESSDDFEEILGCPPYEHLSYEKLRNHAQTLYDSEHSKIMRI